MLRRLASLLAASAVVAACGSPASASPAASSIPPLAPGLHASKQFQPAVTFTVPAGWENPADEADYFELRPAGAEAVSLSLFRDPRAASQDATCPTVPEPSVGTLSSDLVTWIRARPGLVVSTPKLVTVGSLRGTELDLAIAPGWKSSCPFANGLPTVPLFVSGASTYRWVIAGTERLRLDLLDLPGGGLVVVDVDAFDGTLIGDFVTAALPIVRSFAFAGT